MKQRTNHAPFRDCMPPSPTPHACAGSLIDHGNHQRVLCPCACHNKVAEPEPHDHGREESGRYIRVACSCGWKGPWRLISAGLDRRLHSDDNRHTFAVRRADA